MAKEKNWNDRWGGEVLERKGSRRKWNIKEMQAADTSTHIADKTNGSNHCVLITESLIKKLLMHKAIGITIVRLNKMVTCSVDSLSKHPMPLVLLNQSQWVSAKYINKDIWEFYLE